MPDSFVNMGARFLTALFSTPPDSICVLRYSGVVDACHALPLVRTLQQEWPNAKLTWIIGATEASLFGSLPDIEFFPIEMDKGITGLLAARRELRERRFDLLLHLQPSFGANLLTMKLAARVKLGFDLRRAKNFQWLFTTHRIESAERQHVVDGFFGFAERLGIRERLLRWDIPLPEAARNAARDAIPDGTPTVVIYPCGSHRLRTWRSEYYAQVADYVATAYGMRVLLCCGRSAFEKRVVELIGSQRQTTGGNVIAVDSLATLLATLQRATLVLAPDSIAAHLSTAAGTPVLGLYAATNSLRDGPYLSRQLCVDKYDAAARVLLNKPASEVAWGTSIDREGVMDLITPDDVIKKLQSFMAHRAKGK